MGPASGRTSIGEPFEIPTAARPRGRPEWQRCGIARTLEADPMPKQFPKAGTEGPGTLDSTVGEIDDGTDDTDLYTPTADHT